MISVESNNEVIMVMTRIITDSCFDLPENLLENLKIVPITLLFDGEEYQESINITDEEFYDLLKNKKSSPGSASPSPADFLDKFPLTEDFFVITVSAQLSSSYNNALLARKMYLAEFKENFVKVLDSMNASVGQGLIILKLRSLIENNLPLGRITEEIESYIDNLKTFFLLEKMDNLVNSGRLNKILGRLASILNIKFIMGKNDKGEIKLFRKVRGSRKALQKMLDMIGEKGDNFEDRVLGIVHYRCREKAEKFKEQALAKYGFKEAIITTMGPTIATYADEGALLISF